MSLVELLPYGMYSVDSYVEPIMYPIGLLYPGDDMHASKFVAKVPVWQRVHVKREENSVAHSLAKMTVTHDIDQI
jgi:hypothetical protein